MPLRYQMWFNDPVGQYMCSCMSLYGHEITMGALVLSFVLYGVSRNVSGVVPMAVNFREKSVVEVVWTLVPTVILLVIGFPSIILLYRAGEIKDPELTLKVIGCQWYWRYEYGDFHNFYVESYMVAEEALRVGQFRLLTVDSRPVLPTITQIRVLTTSMDVIHSWSLWSLFIKMDAIPGRLNQFAFKMPEPGIEMGMCSELCGVYHGAMPCVVEFVPIKEFLLWAECLEARHLAEEGAAARGLGA